MDRPRRRSARIALVTATAAAVLLGGEAVDELEAGHRRAAGGVALRLVGEDVARPRGQEHVGELRATAGRRAAVAVVAQLEVPQEQAIGAGVEQLDQLGLAVDRAVDDLLDHQVGRRRLHEPEQGQRPCDPASIPNVPNVPNDSNVRSI